VIYPNAAQVLSSHSDGWYQGMAAVTVNEYGKGKAYYQGCRDSGSLKDAALEQVISDAGIQANVESLCGCATSHSRTDGVHTYVFVENYSPTENAMVKLHKPMVDMLTGQTVDVTELKPYSFGIFKSI